MVGARTDEVYCTLVTSDDYVIGANVLAHSLRRGGAHRALAVLVTAVTERNVAELRLRYDHVIPVETISNASTEELMIMGRPDLTSTFTKIRLWQQTQYKKIVYLDADTFCLRAPEELFEIDSDFAAVPELGFPDCFNSGVMVLRPSLKRFKRLLELAIDGASFDGGDQGVLNVCFTEWFRLSFMYNMELNRVYRLYMPAIRHHRERLTVVHFIGKQKPWHLTPEDAKADDSAYSQLYADFVKQWWVAREALAESGPRPQERLPPSTTWVPPKLHAVASEDSGVDTSGQ